MRTVFFGTPPIAVPALRALSEISEVVAVACQPDKPAGRGLVLTAPAVKLAALELGISVHQPVKVKTGNLDAWLRDQQADVAVVLAYGRILPAAVLAAPRLGCVNLHASLLPKYRGAAPINWAIIHGETETGISLMQMDEGLDSGAVFTQHQIPIGATETAGELTERMAQLAAEVVRMDLPRLAAGELEARAQDVSEVSWAPPIQREHMHIRWTEPAASIANRVRGLYPKPAAFCSLRGKSLRVLEARAASSAPASGAAPGTVRLERARALVSTGQGELELLRAQLEGKKALSAAELINGRALKDGDRLE